MSQDRHPSDRGRKNYQPHRRKPARRNTERETVQSDELSSTSGARLIQGGSSHDPYRSASSTSQFKISGNPHPKSPAARAIKAQQDRAQDLSPARSGEPESKSYNDFSSSELDSALHSALGASKSRSDDGSSAASNSRKLDNDPLSADAYKRILSGISYGMPEAEQALSAAEAEGTNPPDRGSSFAAVSNTGAVSSKETRERAARPSNTAAHARVKTRTSVPADRPVQPTAIPVNPQHSHARRRRWPRIAAVAAIVVALIFCANLVIEQIVYNQPITATINGEEMTLEGNERTIEGLLDDGIVTVKPGNYVAVNNAIMREGEGTRCTVIINEQPVSDLNSRINEGDQVVISNGTDVMEDFTDSESVIIPAGFSKVGAYGALHVFLPGQDGEMVTRTGSESGISLEQITKEMIDDRLLYYNANTNGDKVIALTFDDGPWDGTTDQILDILKENGAKATFYTIGDQVAQHSDQIERMKADGHEVATHTWDHASGSGQGVSLDLMSLDERKQEVEKGLAAIEGILGEDTASLFFRAPGGNFNIDTALSLEEFVDGEIGWNIDTEDWQRPGADVVAARIMSATPGDVILMHDGGGDRSQTVEGLRAGLAYLKEQGYKFITVSELIENYPQPS